MRSSRRIDASHKSSSQPLNEHNTRPELTSAWKNLVQTKAALRHIENRLEATPGVGVYLDSISDLKKNSSHTGGPIERKADDLESTTKPTGGSQQSPAKSSSRSPLRNTTQNGNVRKNSSVDFREPLASYRDATPPRLYTLPEAYNLVSVPGSSSSSPHSDTLSSQLVYQRDTRDKQTERDFDTTRTSAVESTEVRYLNDQPALDVLKPDLKAQLAMNDQESGLCTTPYAVSSHRCPSTPSTSPGSVSQRLENLKRHQPDDKLEKLKERIRRQRKHLEETAEKDRSHAHLERPIVATLENNSAVSSSIPTVKIRKIAPARPAPMYKGFNSTETKIKTPDGKVWKEDQFQNLSREVYRDLSRQFAESTKYQQQTELRTERSREKRPSKTVRKVQKVAPISDLHSKPVISPASWREGQKLVEMVLGPAPKLDKGGRRSQSNDERRRDASSERSKPHSSLDRHEAEGQSCEPVDQPKTKHSSSSTTQDQPPTGISTGLLSVDIIGMLDDLQLESKPPEREERARKKVRGSQSSRRGRGGSGSQTRKPVSVWGTTVEVKNSSRAYRSVSPTTRQSETSTSGKVSKKRHYNAETVRQFIARQQEERKKRQIEEKRAAKQEAEKRNQRLQELYKKQREVAKTAPSLIEPTVLPAQKRLQETFTKLLLEEARFGEKVSRTQQVASSIQMRPMYQPSGESDKENKRLEVPQSPSSSDKSSNDRLPPSLSRNDLDGGHAALGQPDRLRPTFPSAINPSSNPVVPSNEYIFSQLLKLEAAVAAGNQKHTMRPPTSPYNSPQQPKMSRIEALKATAASLSNRIETEAQKLVGKGINYGAATSLDVDTTLAPRNTDVEIQHWAERLANAADNDDISQRIRRILTVPGYNSQNTPGLPNAANLLDFMETKEKTLSNPNPVFADIRELTSNTFRQERNGLEVEKRIDQEAQKSKNNKEENWVELHESSSISEGPLLSEGSFSEVEGSPPNRVTDFTPVTNPEKAVDSGWNQRKDLHRLFEFQQDAATYRALDPFLLHDDCGKAPWEELNKGSPLSVINIFTKNLPENVKVIERNSGRNSPLSHPLNSENESGNMVEYEDDFVSSVSSKVSDQPKRRASSPSHFEGRLRSPLEKSSGVTSSHHSPVHLSSHSQNISSGSTSGSSPRSRQSSRKTGTTSDQSDATLVEEQRSSSSPLSETISSESKKRSSDKSSSYSQDKNIQSNDILSESSKHSPQRSSLNSQPGSPVSISSVTNSICEPVRSNVEGANNPPIQQPSSLAFSELRETNSLTELQCSPIALQQRMAAELQYLESIEESIRQLGDVERLMSVTMVQQESASLVHMLKAKQHLHERELYELKIKAEKEALETKLQLEENRQRVARAHIELQESLAATQRENLETLQESTTKMMSQQAEAARHTADAARHIKEITELARTQFAGAIAAPPASSISAKSAQQDEHEAYTKLQEDKPYSDSEVSSRTSRSEEVLSSPNSPSRSDSFKTPHLSDATYSSSHHSPSHSSPVHPERSPKVAEEKKQMNWRVEDERERGANSSSIEEDIPKVANESLCSSIPSMIGETTSVATECSPKFDESMTEDEIEERSFRSLLPSEAHRRGTMEKKSRHQEESEDDGARSHATLTSGTGKHDSIKSQSVHIAFSGGQDSFSQFTLDMVRQYMEDEKARLQHQSSLLHLRQKALEEKTRTELAWLELQKKRLRDKGEDDKMPPIRKKQRGLLIKLQQEQAEIKRLQEANKAARKERRQLLKQQEEIERIRNSTLRLKERLKCAAPETSEPKLLESNSLAANVRLVEDTRSPSPTVSISGSETSCAMQKLKKMCPLKDEKFLTKRHRQLVQRHHDAQELLQWKQQLDQAEAEVRRMEKKALAAWDRTMPLDKNLSESQEKVVSEIDSHHHQSSEAQTDSEKAESSIHTEGPEIQQSGSPTAPSLSVSETPPASDHINSPNYSQDFTSVSEVSSKKSSPIKNSLESVASPSDGSCKTKMQLFSASRGVGEVVVQRSDHSTVMPSETASDQSDIECRIKTLREELKKRKFMAYQLKKEQKKRHKERLKAQEASLLKKLENYNNFIEKTTAELNKEPELTNDTNSQIKDSFTSEQSSIKPSSPSPDFRHSFHSEKTLIDSSFSRNGSPQRDSIRSTALPKDFSYREAFSPAATGGSEYVIRQPSESLRRSSSSRIESGDAEILSEIKSDIQEELISEINSKFEEESSQHLLKLKNQAQFDSQEKLSTHDLAVFHVSQQHKRSSPNSLEERKEIKSSKISEVEENVSNVLSSGQPQLASINFETSLHSSHDLSSGTNSGFQEIAIVSNKEAPTKKVEASAEADGYYDDFESPNEELHSSKISSVETEFSKKDSLSGVPISYSQDEVEEEEEIAEELSKHSEVSETSHKSGRLLELSQHSKDVNPDISNNSNQTSVVAASQASLSPVVDEMPDFNVGDRVLVGGVQPGTLRFKGPTSFANGFWAGLELDKSEGSNNGTYDGVAYFECKDYHGIFAPPDKITHLPDKFELFTDTTEDDDSFIDDMPDKSENKDAKSENGSLNQRNLESENDQVPHKDIKSGDIRMDEEDQVPPKNDFRLNSEHHKESKPLIFNGNTEDIVLECEDTLQTFIADAELVNEANKEKVTPIERGDINSLQHFTPGELITVTQSEREEQKDKDLLGACTDKILNNFVEETVKQFTQIKKMKEEKIRAANQMNEWKLTVCDETWMASVEQKDGLPFIPQSEKEELSSPELHNTPESPVFGISGQEELAKRLAELELSREILDDLGDDQDWFDEDFGLSSRREQQRLKKKEEEAKLSGEPARLSMGGLVSSISGEPQVKTPPRPELPLPIPPKLPEQPAMVVPHSATEVKKMVNAAITEIWDNCGLGKGGVQSLVHLKNPAPSLDYLGKEFNSQDQEDLSIRSYRKAVYDLTWEILQEVFAEEPDTSQPHWIKPRRVKSSLIHRIKMSGDFNKIQEFVTTEVLKVYGMSQEQNQKMEWQKMLKFGKKKRDRVDHILVYELHEEEAQWVNYDEDELFVKMQLADSIFDSLLKDTVDAFTLISEKRSKRSSLS